MTHRVKKSLNRLTRKCTPASICNSTGNHNIQFAANFDYIGMGWQIVPQMGVPVGGAVTVNFPPDLERVQSRLSLGMVKHERKEVRHPEKNTLQALRFEYITESRGSVTVTPDHDNGTLAFRLANANGFELVNVSWPASRIQTDVLDEMAKMIVAQPNTFV